MMSTKPGQQDLVFAEQIRGLYNSTPAIALGGFVLPPLITILFWNLVDPIRALIWTGLVVATSGVWAVALYRYFLRHNNLPHDAHRWLRYALIRTVASGLSWGLFIITDASDSTTSQIIGGTSLIGFGAITVSTLSYHPLAFRIFAVMLFSPFIVWTLLAGNSTGRVMAGLALGGLFYALMASRNLNRLIVESLKNRFANLDLIEQLQEQKALVETARDTALSMGDLAEQARMEAVDANRAKSRFLAAASHDLRQPMHALGLFANAVRLHVTTDQGQRIVDKIEASVGSTEVMFNALLDVSRLDAGVLVPDIKPINLDEMLGRLAAEYSPRAEVKGLTLRVIFCSKMVMSDPSLLERVIRNFISNAIRYTPRGGILIGCRVRGESLNIEVWDTGIGIPQDKLNDIFQEFYQLGNAERDKAKGLGLGLAIVKRIGELLGHPIDVKSRIRRGSKFTVRVPVASNVVGGNADIGLPQLDESLLVGATILVIDDEVNVLEAIELVLKQWGCDVLTAESQSQAVEKLRQQDRAPDVILSDYRLRDGETGIAAIQAIHRDWGVTPAALITGDTARDRLKEATESSYELLHKPLNPFHLKASMCRMLAATVERTHD
jgi:two-component system, sensor histidine kinase